jgi:hypothetical protein
MQFYVRSISNRFLRFLYGFFVQMPLEIYWRFITAYVPTSVQFVNCSGVSDAVLAQQWALAQQGLATAPFPLNYAGGPLSPADKRALTITPKHVTVVSVPDVAVSDLAKFDSNWVAGKDKDPSGVILLSVGLTYETCHSFACCWKKPRIYAAASKIPVTLAYEMQNIILSELGYDVSNR